MPNLNPDPHAYGYVFVPVNRVTSVFASPDDVRCVLAELRALGFDAASLDVFVGDAGAAALDLSGEKSGWVTRKIRDLESLLTLAAGDSHRAADEALRAGGALVAILMDGKEPLKDQVRTLLLRSHATVIRYWGRWSVETLG